MYTVHQCLFLCDYLSLFREDKIIAKVNRCEFVSENGFINTKYLDNFHIAKVNSREMVLIRESRKFISVNKSGFTVNVFSLYLLFIIFVYCLFL